MTETVLIIIAAVWAAIAGLVSWRLKPAWQPHALTAAGAGVLAILSWPSLLCLTAATYATWRIGKLRAHRIAAGVGAIGVIAVLYLVLLWKSGSAHDSDALRVVIPLGMAYYVLRLIHYLIEVDRDGFRAHSLAEYAAYHFFPSTLPVGPIHRFDDFLRDLRRRRWDPDLASRGAARILGGAVKIVLLNNSLLNHMVIPALARVHGHGGVSALYIDTWTYWLNIYLQFSGYSSIAIGVGALLGFTIAENFNWPFLATNIGAFWRRWHMTLSFWCRDYVYTPVLAIWRRPYVAAAASMIVLGVWHAVSLHYLLWGLYHATGLTVWRRWAAFRERVWPNPPVAAQRLWAGFSLVVTLHFVMFSYPTANALEKWIMRL